MGYDGRFRNELSDDEELVALAARHDLDVDDARDVLQRARRESADDVERRSIPQWFAMLVDERRGRSVAPGRRTLLERELGGRPRVDREELAPGRRTLVQGWRQRDAGAAEPRRLEPEVGARMRDAFGFDFEDLSIRTDSPEATGRTRAVVKDGEVHFGEGAYRPGTREGDWLLAHELAHVVQQRGGRAEREGSRQELEREADLAATLVAAGQAASIGLRAPAAGAYAFDEGEDHDVGIGAIDLDAGGVDVDHHDDDLEHADEHALAAVENAQAHAGADGDVADRAGSDADGAAGDGAGDDAAADDAGGAEIDPRAELAAAATPVPAEDGGGGAPGGGGGAPPKPQKEPPNVAGEKPEAGLGQLRGVRPDKVGPALGQVHTAAGADADQLRAKNQANPPKQMSSGAAAGKGTKPANAAAGAKPAGNPDAKAHAEKPVKAEVPGGHEAKQSKQDEAAREQQHAGHAIAGAAQTITSWFGSWAGGTAGEGQAKMSEAETAEMAGSLDRLPAEGSGIATDPGPAPHIEMKGEAQSSAGRDRGDLDSKTASLENQGRADSRTPMGEDHIETTVPTEELSASVPGGAPADPKLPTVAGAASSEEVGIIAQEEHGAEIDGALAKAQGDVAVERTKHQQEEVRARADNDRQVAELKTRTDAEQVKARTDARAAVDKARGEWQGEIDKKGAAARKQADQKVSEGMSEVEREQTKANDEAKREIDKGKQKADEEKQKGEKEAADAKDKGKKKSSGFFGWLSSKAKAFFDGIKKAISAAIDAARKAVKIVIDAAKKAANAAIDLARKAITSAIKAIGKALIAISDVLLAAFPELKAKFQKAINGLVDKAVDAVNKLADGLKKAVQKALDTLGAAIDKALQILEKGLHFIVDAANAVVQGAIKAAEAIAAALGTWVRIIKDVAAGPGSWIGKLGAAVIDGIRNHLWTALQAAVIEWFKSKVMELLGVGGLLLQILLEGGVTTDDIIKMALDALIVAIPVALIAILIEKLVSMIVPAAGAVMAVIEGLQAAWGTISRIIAAFGAFIAFMLAVKGGGAGPLFATLLASAAVVLLDFVANWLLRKLAGPARKVGARLKNMGEKLKRRFKRGKGGKGGKHESGHDGKDRDKHDRDKHDRDKHHRDKHDRDGHDRRKDDEHGDRPKSKEEKRQEERKQEIDRRVEKAQRELPPKVSSLLAKNPSRLRVVAQFAAWRVQYRLSRMELRGSEGQVELFAQVNPTINLAPGWTFRSADVFRVVDRVAGELLSEARAARSEPPGTTGDGRLDLSDRTHPADPAAHFGPAPSSYVVGRSTDGDDLGYRHETVAFGWGRIKPLGDGSGSNYAALQKKLDGVDVGQCLGAMTRNEPVPSLSPEQRGALEELYGLWMGGKEASHPKGTFGNQRDLTHSYMLGQLMQDKGLSLEEAMSLHPAAFGGAQKGAGHVNAEMGDDDARVPNEGTKERKARDERRRREKETTGAWFRHHEAELKAWFHQRLAAENRVMAREPTLQDVEDFVRHQLRKYLQSHPL